MAWRQSRGRTNHLGGMAAEASVARAYETVGRPIAARRWRGKQGEIDLIARDDEGLIFIEVKKSRDFGAAAQHLTRRQMDRICGAASEYVAGEPTGQLTVMRFDLALVDALGADRDHRERLWLGLTGQGLAGWHSDAIACVGRSMCWGSSPKG